VAVRVTDRMGSCTRESKMFHQTESFPQHLLPNDSEFALSELVAEVTVPMFTVTYII
jgi:hypothetical protein